MLSGRPTRKLHLKVVGNTKNFRGRALADREMGAGWSIYSSITSPEMYLKCSQKQAKTKNSHRGANTAPPETLSACLIFSIIWTLIKGPFPCKWHVFVLALLYLFECLNNRRQHSDRLQFLETSGGNVIRFRKKSIMTKCRWSYLRGKGH